MGLAPRSEVKAKEREKNLSYFDSSLKLLRKANYSVFCIGIFPKRTTANVSRSSCGSVNMSRLGWMSWILISSCVLQYHLQYIKVEFYFRRTCITYISFLSNDSLTFKKCVHLSWFSPSQEKWHVQKILLLVSCF
jgi:hypothetical protein